MAGWRGDRGGCRTVGACRSRSSRRTRVPASLWLIYPNQHWFPYLAFSPSSEFQNGPIHAAPEENERDIYGGWTSVECGPPARGRLIGSPPNGSVPILSPGAAPGPAGRGGSCPPRAPPCPSPGGDG